MTLRYLPSRLVMCCIIGLSILIIFGLPFTHWWLTGDDFCGIFLGFKSTSWKDVFYFFYEGNAGQGSGNPGGYVTTRADFLSVYYRPLYCVYLALQYWCFGTSGYGYFLCNVTAHAITASLFFYLISLYTSRWTALISAGLFTFHPQIAYRFGSVVNFHYYVNVVLVLCIALLLRNYLTSTKHWQLGLALLLFAASLCTRETTLVLPAIIGILLLVHAYKQNAPFPWPKIFVITSLFGSVALGYLGLRLWLYPLGKIAANGVLLPYALKGNFASVKLQEFLVFFYDLLFLSWLPWGNKLLKIAILLPMLSLLGYAFYHCRQKLLVVALFLCGIILLWPGIISFYSPRYIYESMPFFVASYTALFATCTLGQSTKMALKILATAFICCLSIFTFTAFQARETKLHAMHQAVRTLAKIPGMPQRPLCFLTNPSDGFAGGYNPHIFWILFNNRDHEIHFDSALCLTQLDSNVVKPGKWFNAIAPYYDQNYVIITPIEQGFRFTTTNPNKIIFDGADPARTATIGALTVLQKNTHEQTTTMGLRIDDTLWAKKPLFINWNYATKQFDVIDRF